MNCLRGLVLLSLLLLTMSCNSKEREETTEEVTIMVDDLQQSAEPVMIPEIYPAELKALQKGDTYKLKVNDSLSFDLRIGSKNQFVKGITSLTATIVGEMPGMATLSIQADTVVGNLQFPGEDWMYVLSYDRELGRHQMKKTTPEALEGDEMLTPDSAIRNNE
ncbi:hypothetical protein AB2B38_010020 [Balneola sp. MJW-20]|uniref:hypothetical protein n=1 Tax=Gracilimonas aurantiaca TaxID=3234185 RepID=UPI00346621B4